MKGKQYSLNGRATDHLPPDEEDMALEAMQQEMDIGQVTKKAKNDDRIPLPFSKIESILSDMNEKHGTTEVITKPACFGCYKALFSNPDNSQIDIMNFIDRLINLVSLDHLYRTIHRHFEKKRQEAIEQNGGIQPYDEWKIEMIKEHFEEHIVDHRIQDRLRTDSLLLSERLLKNSYLLENPTNGKLDVDEKLYKLWLATMETIRKLGVLPDDSVFTTHVLPGGGGGGQAEGGEPSGTAGGVTRKKRTR